MKCKKNRLRLQFDVRFAAKNATLICHEYLT